MMMMMMRIVTVGGVTRIRAKRSTVNDRTEPCLTEGDDEGGVDNLQSLNKGFHVCLRCLGASVLPQPAARIHRHCSRKFMYCRNCRLILLTILWLVLLFSLNANVVAEEGLFGKVVIVMWLCQICFKSCMETSLQFCGSGWDQQMSYTWFSDRWVLPAPYYKTSMVYEDRTLCAHCRARNLWSQSISINVNQCAVLVHKVRRLLCCKDLGFDVDVFFLDTNFLDAKPPEEDCHGIVCECLWWIFTCWWNSQNCLSHGSHLSCGLAGSKSQHVQLQE